MSCSQEKKINMRQEKENVFVLKTKQEEKVMSTRGKKCGRRGLLTFRLTWRTND